MSDLIDEKLTNEFLDFYAHEPVKALSLISGLLVGLVEHETEKQGFNKSGQISIENIDGRTITISADKSERNHERL